MRASRVALTIAVLVGAAVSASGQAAPFGRSSQYMLDGSIRDVAIADFTGDGLADLYIARSSSEFEPMENVILANMGDGIFVVSEDEDQYFYRQSACEAQPTWGVAAADFNNDGLVDVALGNQAGTVNEVWLRSETGFTLYSSFGVSGDGQNRPRRVT